MELKEYYEGKLFIHRWFSTFGSFSHTYHQDHYCVIKGVVYIIEREGKLYATGDTLESLVIGKMIGDFDPKKPPKFIENINFKHSYKMKESLKKFK